jgi:hypothetical protein
VDPAHDHTLPVPDRGERRKVLDPGPQVDLCTTNMLMYGAAFAAPDRLRLPTQAATTGTSQNMMVFFSTDPFFTS